MAAINATTPAGSPSTQPRKAPVAPASEARISAPAAPVIHHIDPAQRALADERTAVRIEAALRADATLRARARHVHVAVTDGMIRIFGAVRGREALALVEAAIRGAARTDTIGNDVRIIGARWGD
jgi:hypothetical protein